MSVPSAKCGKKCENHNIREEYLKESVLVSIQARIRSVIDLESLVRYVDALPLQQREIIRLQAQLAQKQEEAERYKRLFRSLYERLSEGILTQNEFLEFKAVYAHRCDEAERAAGALQREIKAATAGTSGTFRWIEDFGTSKPDETHQKSGCHADKADQGLQRSAHPHPILPRKRMPLPG